ncbi:MAG TPA: hypothetical protein VN786_02355 [Acidimicrobiales bacterium]|nr:hypothetical protein [Acidimicrobiales bacterium]
MSPSPASLAGDNPVGHGRGRIAAAMVAFGVLVTGLSGCTTSVTYVGSSTQDMYFKIPNTWEVFNQSTLQENGWIDPAASSQAALAGQSHPVYETVAGANPKVARSVDTQSGPYPWAMAQVVALDGQDQANTSLAALADENYPIDQLNQDGDRVQQLSPTRLLVDGALRGSRVAYQIVSQQTGAISFEQVAFLNSATDKVWLLDVGCSPACFRDHRAVLDSIVNSFIVTGQGR